MQTFEAPTLEEAYAAAAKAFSCSVTDLQIQVVQHPSRGIFGFGRKPAIIVAARSVSATDEVAAKQNRTDEGKKADDGDAKSTKDPQTAPETSKEQAREKAQIEAVVLETLAERGRLKTQKKEEEAKGKEAAAVVDSEIFDNFYQDKPDIAAVVPEIESTLNRIFAEACFRIDPVRVEVYDEETVLVEISGEDAALLIGKEGYRYKALAHLLYNWIHHAFGFRLRLEIAEFLKNQEKMIEKYLEPIVERIEREGRAQTKVLDGILVQIALVQLRNRFPDKYVAIRSNREGGRYVVVNDFLEKR